MILGISDLSRKLIVAHGKTRTKDFEKRFPRISVKELLWFSCISYGFGHSVVDHRFYKRSENTSQIKSGARKMKTPSSLCVRSPPQQQQRPINESTIYDRSWNRFLTFIIVDSNRNGNVYRWIERPALNESPVNKNIWMACKRSRLQLTLFCLLFEELSYRVKIYFYWTRADQRTSVYFPWLVT